MVHGHVHGSSDYVPGLGVEWLTPYYDAMQTWVFQERRFRRPLIEAVATHIGANTGAVVLEVGCGTATVSLLIQDEAPQATVVGTDIDRMMLAQAQRKSDRADWPVTLAAAGADAIPAADGAVDAVVSSLMFHHLTTPQKAGMLAEARRVLRPGGALFLFDFGPPASPLLAEISRTLFGRFEHVDVNMAGGIPSMLADAGFAAVTTDDVAFGGLLKLYSGRA